MGDKKDTRKSQVSLSDRGFVQFNSFIYSSLDASVMSCLAKEEYYVVEYQSEDVVLINGLQDYLILCIRTKMSPNRANGKKRGRLLKEL